MHFGASRALKTLPGSTRWWEIKRPRFSSSTTCCPTPRGSRPRSSSWTPAGARFGRTRSWRRCSRSTRSSRDRRRHVHFVHDRHDERPHRRFRVREDLARGVSLVLHEDGLAHAGPHHVEREDVPGAVERSVREDSSHEKLLSPAVVRVLDGADDRSEDAPEDHRVRSGGSRACWSTIPTTAWSTGMNHGSWRSAASRDASHVTRSPKEACAEASVATNGSPSSRRSAVSGRTIRSLSPFIASGFTVATSVPMTLPNFIPGTP